MTFMDAFTYTVLWIGAVVSFFLLMGILSLLIDLRRAIRQTIRIYSIYLRRSNIDYRKWRNWWNIAIFQFVMEELTASYDSTTIGIWKLPYNPSQPIRRVYYYHKD